MLYTVRHNYDREQGNRYSWEEVPVAVFDDESEAYDYAEKYSDIRAYGMIHSGQGCLTFGDLSVDDLEDEDDFACFYGTDIALESLPRSPKTGPDFSEFEKKREEFLKMLSEKTRFPRLTMKYIDDPSEYDGNGHLFTEHSADEGNSIIFRQGGFVNRIGYVIFDRNPLEDSIKLGNIILDESFCLTDLEPLYEKIVDKDAAELPVAPMTPKEANDFADRAYEAYQLQWMISQGKSLYDLRDIIKENARELLECGDVEGPVTADGCDKLIDGAIGTFWESTGFGSGSIYVCRNEFVEKEFQNKKYMEFLFDIMSYVPEQYAYMPRWERAVEALTSDSLYAVSIDWDTDEEDGADDLPDEIEIPCGNDREWDEERISDYITEQTGFCHKGFALEWR